MTRNLRHSPILIAGGGIGGLATALALARRGIASHVLESRSAFAVEGAGIQIGPNGTRILTELGIAEALSPHVARPGSIRVLDGETTRTIVELPLGPWIAARHGSPYWVAHRSDLHRALLTNAEASPLITITLNAEAYKLDRTDNGVAVEMRSSGSAPTTPALSGAEGCGFIAADGLWSDTRSTLFNAEPPRFDDRSAARAIVSTYDAPPDLRAETTFVWLAPGAHVVHYPVRGGRDIAVVVITTATEANRDWSQSVTAAWVLERTRTFNPLLNRLLEAAEGWRRWSLYTLPPPKRISDGPVALLGDAAHPILPFLAQGGVMALEDAAVIARELAASPGDVASAFARYQRARLSRIARVARASRRNGQIFHLGGGLAIARNTAMRVLGGASIMGAYEWLYGWHDAGQ